MTALVLRDLSHRLTPVLGESSVTYRLTGPDGGAFRFGWGTTPAATLSMDTVDFHLLASGRLSPDQVRSRALITIDGDAALAERVLAQTTVAY